MRTGGISEGLARFPVQSRHFFLARIKIHHTTGGPDYGELFPREWFGLF